MRKALARILALVAIGGCGTAIYLVLNENHILHRHHGSTSKTPKRRVRHVNHHYTLYRVRAGDSFGKIADKHHVTVAQIARLNPTVDPQQLHPGQKLHLR